jgi:hypothetical protein
MSIANRVKKAEEDHAKGDYENALIQALIAVAATSKKRYPNAGDAQAFTQFLKDDFLKKIQPNISILGGGLKVLYEGKLVDIEPILYKYVRCYLLHEAEIAPKLRILGSDLGFSISYDSGVLEIGWGVVEILTRIVKEAPENQDALGSPQ